MNEYQQDGGPTYGEQVRASCAAKGLRQKDLAERLKISPQYLNDVIFGRRVPGEKVAMGIYRHTGVPLETPYQQQLRRMLKRVVEAAERAHMGDPLPAEEWFALRDNARAMLYPAWGED